MVEKIGGDLVWKRRLKKMHPLTATSQRRSHDVSCISLIPVFFLHHLVNMSLERNYHLRSTAHGLLDPVVFVVCLEFFSVLDFF